MLVYSEENSCITFKFVSVSFLLWLAVTISPISSIYFPHLQYLFPPLAVSISPIISIYFPNYQYLLHPLSVSISSISSIYFLKIHLNLSISIHSNKIDAHLKKKYYQQAWKTCCYYMSVGHQKYLFNLSFQSPLEN